MHPDPSATTTSPSPPSTPAPGRLPRLVRWLLRVPLFYKILLANAALVLVGTIVGSMVTADYVRRHPGSSTLDLVGALAVMGILATVLVNALILRLALHPLDALERTAARVQRGDLDARVPHSVLADRELDRLTRTFNGMLESGAANRERLREVASTALNAAEEERKRIARELHDETAQLLAALLIRIRVVKNASGSDAVAGPLEDMRREIGHALNGVRRFARGLRPPALDELGLIPAIESHVRSIREITEIDLSLDSDSTTDDDLPPEASLAVYRIVQEALSNVVRHSGATRAAVRVVREPDRLVVTVEDDGHGFNVPEVRATGGGLGLFGMGERAAYLGGRVEVQSAPGTGTRVRAEIPLGDGGAVAVEQL
ncbi:MAG TPA: ATP-binding protein [Longimicrobium sp.]|jgi:signal transduction histidine kinase|uniref:sensor histidine kinase n=1 Tax=Longimicrobium sp. TaxID=2029185 RepID=UPI002EDAEBFD